MRRARLLATLLLLAAPARADDDAPASRAFLQVTTPRAAVWVGEPFVVLLRFGVDRTFFDEHAVELFRRPLDLPVQIDAPWLDGAEGLRALGGAPLDAGMRLAVNGREVAGVDVGGETRGTRTFDVVEVDRLFLPETPGPQTLAASLRFAWATRFEEDFLGGRVPVDRQDVRVDARPLTLEVRPLPAEGRPEGYGGVVGRYTIAAGLAPGPREGVLRLAVRLEGTGNLVHVERPLRERVPGFHVYGVVDDHAAPVRTIAFELAPLAGTTEVPPIPFAYFDPAPPGAYRVAHTAPIPLDRPGPAPAAEEEGAGPGPAWLGGVAAALALVLLVVGQTVRRRRAAARPTSPPRIPWRERLAADGADPAERAAEALAAHLGVLPAAVIGPGLEGRLLDAGLEAALAARTARALEGLVAARFAGGRSTSLSTDELADLLDAVDAALAPREPDA